jgi:hypothetical protein
MQNAKNLDQVPKKPQTKPRKSSSGAQQKQIILSNLKKVKR